MLVFATSHAGMVLQKRPIVQKNLKALLVNENEMSKERIITNCKSPVCHLVVAVMV